MNVISTIFNVLFVLFNAIIEHCYIPLQFLSGIITPVIKKGIMLPIYTNQNRILVTFWPVIITKNISILLNVAALFINECIVEAKELTLPLFIAFLDSQRAFNVVLHPSLKCKLFLNGICGKIWKVIDILYTNLTSKVKWSGCLSDSFPFKKGVRQGVIL